ncbi:hypothetical protein AB0K60_33255 [Thermopolyspora sp. NPDC052614]|uniref:hypothetical protein n=1 Tax=Thermopolyspora sp. NPDC052614 TaxID=3155682 RepID=UPI00341FBE3F
MSAALSAAPPPPPPDSEPAATVKLAQALTPASEQRLTGLLRVTGSPGGVIALARGVVTAVTSPGAPDAAALLLRSGRITETDWSDAVKAGAADERIGAELVARTLVGATELRAICQMAALDGAFAIAAGRVDECVLERDTAASWLSVPLDIEPDWLLGETERRLAALRVSRRTPISPFLDRLVPTPRAAERPQAPPSDLRREILRHLNGRRSCRDVAFLLGRGLYAVTVEISAMLAEGVAAVHPPDGDPSHRPRSPGDRPWPEPPPGAEPDRLPRRAPGASGFRGDSPLRPLTHRPRLRLRAHSDQDAPPGGGAGAREPVDDVTRSGERGQETRDQETGEP